jgi:hypothetical protein
VTCRVKHTVSPHSGRTAAAGSCSAAERGPPVCGVAQGESHCRTSRSSCVAADVSWPASTAAECAAWVRELLR